MADLRTPSRFRVASRAFSALSTRMEVHGRRHASDRRRIMCRMPRISAFYGIVIYMYWREHPPAHFHAFYGNFEASVAIDDGSILAGQLPMRAYRLAREWAELQRAELRADWERAQAMVPLVAIEPLP